jgi:hypothetical protein
MVECGLEAANGTVCVRRRHPPAGVFPGEHGVTQRVIRGTVLRGFPEDRVVHLPGGLQVRRVALDCLPQDLDRQHWLDSYRTLR